MQAQLADDRMVHGGGAAFEAADVVARPESPEPLTREGELAHQFHESRAVGRGAGTIVTVSSGIGFLPFPVMPAYAASKAGVHAYSEALRAQLGGTGVEVSELVPPAVATRREAKQRNPHALDLADFAIEVMNLLQADPTPHEILVKGVLMHRWAERDRTYDELVAQRSQALAMLPSRQ